jgi:hypothetical protein
MSLLGSLKKIFSNPTTTIVSLPSSKTNSQAGINQVSPAIVTDQTSSIAQPVNSVREFPDIRLLDNVPNLVS